MPRGGLQIVQPSNLPDARLKAYADQHHAHDAITWRAIIAKRPVRGLQCFTGGMEQSCYYRGVMEPAKLRYAAAAPLDGPILPGYAGALHVYRTAAQGAFTDQHLHALAEAAQQFNRLARDARASRLAPECATDHALTPRPAARQVVLDAAISSVVNGALTEMDTTVADQLQHDARRRLQQLHNGTPQADRLSVPDSMGDLWNFRVSSFPHYPGLGDGPFLFYCLEPEYCDWQTLRATDVGADAELARLVPALHFMQQEYRKSPTLGEIARTVHLSPFHFHRRFTHVLGITPKHFLLQCQIFQAKRMLEARQLELADIANACGFAHQSHFTSRFKQATGLTPTRWRKLATSNPQPMHTA